MTNTRQTFYPPEEILSEARRFIEAHGEESFDVVTVVGEGEPTLYKPLDAIGKAAGSYNQRLSSVR